MLAAPCADVRIQQEVMQRRCTSDRFPPKVWRWSKAVCGRASVERTITRFLAPVASSPAVGPRDWHQASSASADVVAPRPIAPDPASCRVAPSRRGGFVVRSCGWRITQIGPDGALIGAPSVGRPAFVLACPATRVAPLRRATPRGSSRLQGDSCLGSSALIRASVVHAIPEVWGGMCCRSRPRSAASLPAAEECT